MGVKERHLGKFIRYNLLLGLIELLLTKGARFDLRESIKGYTYLILYMHVHSLASTRGVLLRGGAQSSNEMSLKYARICAHAWWTNLSLPLSSQRMLKYFKLNYFSPICDVSKGMVGSDLNL